jgi:AcrR family transcriptional regulator
MSTLYSQRSVTLGHVSTPPASPPIWARPEPGARRPRFSRDQIAAAALVIADAEGFEAVSIRRVAAALGAGTMSLYRYISAKSDLVALLVPDGQLPADWRAALATIARRTRAALLAHPWAVQARPGPGAAGAAGAGDPGPGPNAVRRREQSLAAVAAAPLDHAARLDLLAILDDYVFGHVLRAGGPPGPAPSAGPAQLAARFERGLAALLDGAASR